MDVAGAFGTAADFDDLPYLSVPTRAVGYEMLVVVAAKKLDAFSTVLVVSDPNLSEIVPFTRLFVETFGVVAGVILASVLGIFAVFASAEVSHRTCKRTRRLVGASTAPYPYIEYHVAYFLGTVLFVGAFVWNASLLV
ncbi:MAG: hypothetical protein U5J64_05000 [Halobacteriales archaeon]|nr:hypothetical protein [Halobacteriales archaeon]